VITLLCFRWSYGRSGAELAFLDHLLRRIGRILAAPMEPARCFSAMSSTVLSGQHRQATVRSTLVRVPPRVLRA
jgi:hypothetical protein